MSQRPIKLAINNRGEVAVRIIRTCQEMGIKTLLLHSTADKNTEAFRLADETFELPGNTPQETYLNIEHVLAGLKQRDPDLVHPGFGFLSENAAFAKAVTEAGFIFVGPPADVIEVAGNKVKAKKLASKAGVPTTPAFTGSPDQPKEFLSHVNKLGYPCLVKAASGGGGKGMKLVKNEKELFENVASAQREALNAFGSSQIFVEKYISNPRHIEVQIFGGPIGEYLHFFERECSIQRRHQKIFEESPSPALTPELRHKITDAALNLAKAIGYKNAGTVEFLLSDSGQFYFMELNTRLQVEHTVTEQVCGIDFVRLQIMTALGEPLHLKQEDIQPRGHALEVRVYSENPEREFLPSIGNIAALHLPAGPHRRFDFGYGVGDQISPYYDPMIGKIITWAPTREENRQRMLATLKEFVLFGVYTNVEFLKAVLEKPKFQRGFLSTSFLEEEFPGGFMPAPLTSYQENFLQEARQQITSPPLQGNWTSPWQKKAEGR